MVLNYKVYFENNVFKYNGITYNSYLEIGYKDIKKIYDILNRLNILQKRAEEAGIKKLVYNYFVIIFDFLGSIVIERASNWLNIEEEVPIIKRELSKYIKEYDKENIKDMIIKIKSLKKGSGNKIKEELKWEKLLFQER